MAKKSNKFTTLFKFRLKGVLYTGSYVKEEDGIHVDYRYSYKGDLGYACCTTVKTETAMKIFFYEKLEGLLGSQWISMKTKIRKAVEPYEIKIKKIQSKYPGIELNCYRDIMGDFDNLDFESGQKKLENWIKHS